jgi:hypothetical protein
VNPLTTKKQVIDILAKLEDLNTMIDRMKQTCDTALFEYTVNGQIKGLSQTDIDALITDYQNLKVELKIKVNALP